MANQQSTNEGVVRLDFSGGVNNLFAANRIKDNELADASNVWYDTNAIRSRGAAIFHPITTANFPFLASSNTYTFASYTPKPPCFSFVASAALGNYLFTTVENGQLPVYMSDPVTPTVAFMGYSPVGSTVTTTGANTTLTGTGTSWSTSNIAVGDWVFIAGDANVFTVSAINSTTNLTLNGTPAAHTNVQCIIVPLLDNVITNYIEPFNGSNYVTAGPNRALFSWDPNKITSYPSAPQCYVLKAFQNYLFGANTNANPSRVFWSALLDGTTWPASNFIDVNPSDGQQIVGLFNDGAGALLVIKNRSIYKLIGQTFDPTNPTYQLVKMFTPPDCVFDSATSWQYWNGQYVLWGGNGLYSYTGANYITKLDISDRLLGTWNTTTWTPATFLLTPTNRAWSGVTFNGKYWLSSGLFSGGAGSQVIVERNNTFWLENLSQSQASTGYVNFFTVYQAGSSLYNNLWAAYSANGASGLVLLDQGFSNESINSSFTTKIFEFPSQQRFGTVYLHFKRQATGSITFGYKIDGGTTTNVTVSMTTGTGNITISPPIVIGQVGTSIQFIVSHNSSAEDFEVYQIELETTSLRT